MSVKLTGVGCSVYPELDAAVVAGKNGDEMLLALSFFDRSLQDLKAFTASFQLSMINDKRVSLWCDEYYVCNYGTGTEKYTAAFSKRYGNKDSFYHGLLLYEGVGLGKDYILCRNEEKGRMCYNELMETTEWPILPEWGDVLLAKLETIGAVTELPIKVIAGKATTFDKEMFSGSTVLKFNTAYISRQMGDVISELLQSGLITIDKKAAGQKPLAFRNLDDYYEKYGSATVENLEKQMHPLTELSGDISGVALRTMRLYPQQISMVNAITALISGKKKAGKANYCFVNLGCGTGKTIISLSALEKYHVDKYLRENPGKTVKDVYGDPKCIKYRAVVLCPGHMVEKWVKEAETQLPFAKASAIYDFSQLLKIREKGKPSGREILVMSKDFAKYSYSVQPVPSIRKKGEVRRKECDACGKSYDIPGNICPDCGHRGFHPDMSYYGLLYKTTGLMCPECGNVLVPYHQINGRSKDELLSLDAGDFDNPRTDNARCYWCNTSLWEPYVKNLELPWWCDGQEHRKEPSWKRISVYANAKCDSKKSIWAHKRYQKDRIDHACSERCDCAGVRKYSPAQYIKRYLGGCIDFLIADECHIYKSTSGQGEAFNALTKVAKKTLCLTGTLTGGKAEDLFYTLYRLDSTRMRALGFNYSDSVAFSYRYGNVKKTKYYSDDEEEPSERSFSTRGRSSARTSTKVEPGISPLIFTEFLLDRAVFLDLDDMSSNLPQLNETVVSVKPEGEEEKRMFDQYSEVIDTLTGIVRQDASEFGLMGAMLQFSLSWLDKPYTENYQSIRSPATGEVAAMVPQYQEFRKLDHLTTKEKKLIELVKSELSEDRMCFVFLEYTASEDTNVSDRLKSVLQNALGERVEILRSSSPEPAKREAYIHQLAEEGVRVIITNPKCCETGLDFIFKGSDGREYNYPTLIFFQLGYSLFTVQQASRRHYRLIQNRECRTYYMCWAGSAQEKVIGIISKKMVAASAIQGHFSTEGLMSMAQGVDARLELARSLSSRDTKNGADLQGMFDVLKANRESGKLAKTWEPMKTLNEVLSEETYKKLFGTEEKPEKVVFIESSLPDETDDIFAFSL